MAEAKKHEALSKPIKINKVEIKNRIAMAPMCTLYNTHDGYVIDQMVAYFAARARGGTGLLVTSPLQVSQLNVRSSGFHNLVLLDNSHKPGLAKLVETAHYFGAKIFGQISSLGVGRQGKMAGARDPSQRIPAPSETEPYHIAEDMVPEKQKEHARRRGWSIWPVPGFENGDRPRALTVEEIVTMEDEMAKGARLAKMCRFDGVEMHFPHGYCGYQFLSPRTNFRNDLYGGSFENRTRVLRNCLTKVRQAVGPDFAVGYRISAAEHMPGGLEVEDTVEICKASENWGADFIHLSDGCYEAWKYFFPDEDGTILGEAQIIKSALKIPVITPSVHNPDMAEEAIKGGKTDMISLGRQLIADPEWANKVARGEKFTKCIRCNIGCIRRLLVQMPARCEINPTAGYEELFPEYRMSSSPKKESWYPTVEG